MPNKPLQPTRAAEPFGQREPPRFGGMSHPLLISEGVTAPSAT